MFAQLLLVCQALVVVTFAVSAFGKIGRTSYQGFRASLPLTVRLPARLAGPAAAAVVTCETAAVTLLVLGFWLPVARLAGFALAATLLAIFTGAIGLMLRDGVMEPCRCFGPGNHPPSVRHLLANLALLVAAAIGAAGSSTSPAPKGEAVYYVLGLANLVLTLIVLQRLAEHNALLRKLPGVGDPEPTMLAAGESIRDFTAITVDGATVTRSGLTGHTLVAFLSPTCPACAESLPSFAARAETAPGGRQQVLAVVVGDDSDAVDLRQRLATVARVIVEPAQGPVARAFGVTGFPAFALLSGPTVVGSHFIVDRVPEAAAAPEPSVA